jgi:hypothetical protein
MFWTPVSLLVAGSDEAEVLSPHVATDPRHEVESDFLTREEADQPRSFHNDLMYNDSAAFRAPDPSVALILIEPQDSALARCSPARCQIIIGGRFGAGEERKSL